MRLRPQRRLLEVTAAWAALGLPAALWPLLVTPWWAIGAALAASALLDLLVLRGQAPPRAQRTVARNLPQGVWSTVQLDLENKGPSPLDLELHDHHPSTFDTEGMPSRLQLDAGHQARLQYRVRPPRRGWELFGDLEVVQGSPWRLWRWSRRIDLGQSTRVFPNFAEIAHYTLLATANRLGQMGVKQLRRRGEGNEFHQLREYRRGDSLRQIDWKATSRYRKLISREYQDERDQQLLFLLDCGQRMRHEDGNRAHLDEALNAVLLLAYVALRQGDAVGLMTFGAQQRWFAPRKGAAVVNKLLEGTFDLQATDEASDFRAAAAELLARQRRRALVVLVTTSREEDSADLDAAIRMLQRHHLTILADLREAVLDDIGARPIGTLDQALEFQACQAHLAARRDTHKRLRHHGARLLDLRAEQLPVALVNQYLAEKQSGSL